MDRERSFYQRVADLVEQTGTLPQHHRIGGPRFSGRKIKRAVLVILIAAALLLALAYAADTIVVHYRAARNREVFDNVKIDLLYVIHQKSGRTEFADGGSEAQTCVRSAFPHMGHAPCWYLRRHTLKHIEL